MTKKISELNNSYNHVINNLQDYMFNNDKMFKCIKYKVIDKIKNIKLNLTDTNNNQKNNYFFVPKQKDTLFWCYYIIINGDIKYEMENKNLLNEKKLKINLIEKIRKHKKLLKKIKLSTISNIENQLVNENNIDLHTFFSLCYIDNINIIFIDKVKKYYYQLMSECFDNTNINNNDIYAIYKINNNYGYELISNDNYTDLINNYYKVDNIEKPIKSHTYYKVDDLINICNKLQINIYIVDEKTNQHKTKNKKDLYESLIQYF